MTTAVLETAARAASGMCDWDTFEQFAQEMQLATIPRRHIECTLHLIQKHLHADYTFWCPSEASAPMAGVGPHPLPHDRCRALVTALGQRVRHSEGLEVWINPRRGDGLPHTAVLARVGTSHPVWLGAVTFDPERCFNRDDGHFLAFARRMLVSHHQRSHNLRRLKQSLTGLLRCLMATIEAKDPYTAGHSERVGRIAVLIGQQMKLRERDIRDLLLAGLLHDVGKIGIPDQVLEKPGKLTADELALIQQHPVIGDRIVATAPQLGHLRVGVRYHHERMDGKGYPDHLTGDAIPLMARILAVADAVDAMLSPRRYRLALTPPKIDDVLQAGAGVQWDAHVVNSFLAISSRVYPPIYQMGVGDSAAYAIERMVTEEAEGSTIFHRALDECE